jgi:hypothetical protein
MIVSNKINKPSGDSTELTSGEKEYVKARESDRAAEDISAFKKPTDAGPVDDVRYRHEDYDPEAAKKKNFDRKIYMFPESYNALRKELMTHWPHTWQGCQWYMANNAQQFVAYMNDALNLKVQFDSAKVDSICKTFLDELRTSRGVSKLH